MKISVLSQTRLGNPLNFEPCSGFCCSHVVFLGLTILDSHLLAIECHKKEFFDDQLLVSPLKYFRRFDTLLLLHVVILFMVDV